MDGKYDIIFVLPYPFTDHPSFPEGVLKRYLEINGFSVGVIETPFWQQADSMGVLGRPQLFFAIISGPVDSIVLNYTANRKRRNTDLYQMNGTGFFDGYPPSIKYKIRPDMVSVVFANRIRQLYKQIPIVIGGVEASQRTFSHFDFQKEKIKRSILFDSRADLLVNGMGEKQVLNIARYMRDGGEVSRSSVPGTSRIVGSGEPLMDSDLDFLSLPDHSQVVSDPKAILELEKKVMTARQSGKALIQRVDNRSVVQFPSQPYSRCDLDTIYGLDYARQHPGKRKQSEALKMNLFSITSHRGCGGGCAFCAIACHEGKQIISRSEQSILNEIDRLKRHPRWRAVISDIGGGSAESYGSDCANSTCSKSSCLHPNQCLSYRKPVAYRELLRTVRRDREIKQVFIGSGLRYDQLLAYPELLEDIMRYHCGRFLRVAPEHSEDRVLQLMNKPGWKTFLDFYRLFQQINRGLKRKIELSPYLVIGFPGEREQDVFEMKRKLKSMKLKTSDVQIFTPTPGTHATAMYHASMTADGQLIPVERDIRKLQKRKQILLSN